MNPLLILIAAQAAQSPVLTVDQAVEIALKDAFAVRSTEIVQRRAQDLVNLAKAGAGLNVNLQGNYTRVEQWAVKQSAFGGGGFGPQPDTATLSLNVSQVIDVSGAVRRAVQQARLQRDAAALNVEAQKNIVRSLVRFQCFAVLQSQQAVTIQEAQLRAAQERLSKGEVRFRADAIPKFDVIRLETEVRQAEQALVDARLNARLAKQALNNLLARDIETPFELAPVEGKPLPSESPDALVELALKTRPDLKAAEASIKALNQALAREKLGKAPQVVAGLSHSETLTELGPSQARGTTAGVLTVTLPLFDSDLTATRVRSARKDVEQAQIQLDQLKLAAALEVRQALTRVASANEALQTAIKTEELAREGLRLAQLRYDEGVGILVDVTTAQAQLTGASLSASIARYSALTALAELSRALGADALETRP